MELSSIMKTCHSLPHRRRQLSWDFYPHPPHGPSTFRSSSLDCPSYHIQQRQYNSWEEKFATWSRIEYQGHLSGHLPLGCLSFTLSLISHKIIAQLLINSTWFSLCFRGTKGRLRVFCHLLWDMSKHLFTQNQTPTTD